MADPIMLTVAAALAGKAAEVVAAGGRTAWSALVRPKAADDHEAIRILAAGSGSTSDAGVGELALHLEVLATTDRTFGDELRRLLAAAGAKVSANRSAVVNQNSGTMHSAVVQAGEVQGVLWFATSAPTRSSSS
jgi:hypothetical protein